jgi:hypothetical protein
MSEHTVARAAGVSVEMIIRLIAEAAQAQNAEST